MNSNECLICYEKIKNNNFCITECNHAYCLTCMIKAVLNKTECPYCKYKLVEIDENQEEEEIDENHVEEVNIQVFNNIEFPENDDTDSDYEGEEGNGISRSYNLRSRHIQIQSIHSVLVQSSLPPRFIEVPNENIENARILQNKKKKIQKNKKLLQKFSLQKAIDEIKLIEYKVKKNSNKKSKKTKINKNRSFKF